MSNADTCRDDQADLQQAAAGLHVPLAAHAAYTARKLGTPVVVGLCGSQGSGKTTTAQALVRLLPAEFGLTALSLSIDDFYFTREQRAALARAIHPLFATRGVPGTHEVPLALATLRSLLRGAATALPSFDKATDQRLPAANWRVTSGPVDVIIFEGWCVGARPQAATALQTPVNSLESQLDPAGTWRRHVNRALGGEYQELFAVLGSLVLLAAPDFDVVYQWRLQQEQQLLRRVQAAAGDTTRVMDESQVRQFVAHYERLTRHILEEMPARADVTVRLDRNRGTSGPWLLKGVAQTA